MSPGWWEAHLSGMNYFCVRMTVFSSSNIAPHAVVRYNVNMASSKYFLL